MEVLRKQFSENIRKEHLEGLFLAKRKKLLALSQNSGLPARYGHHMEEAKNKIKETSDTFDHNLNYSKMIQVFEGAISEFENSRTPDDHFRALTVILEQSWDNLQGAPETSTISAFFDSGLPKYTLHFLTRDIRSNHQNIEQVLCILSNAALGTQEQVEILVALKLLDALADLVADQQAMSGSLFGQLLWLLANFCGIHENSRRILIGHPTLLDRVFHCWDTRITSLGDSQTLTWFCSNMLLAPFPAYAEGQKFLRRGVTCLLKHCGDPQIFADAFTLLANWLQAEDEPIRRVREFADCGVWSLVRGNIFTPKKQLLLKTLVIVDNLTASEDEELLSSMVSLDLVTDIIKLKGDKNPTCQALAALILRNLVVCFNETITSNLSGSGVLNFVQETLVSSNSDVRLASLQLLFAYLLTGNEVKFELFMRAEPRVAFVMISDYRFSPQQSSGRGT